MGALPGGSILTRSRGGTPGTAGTAGRLAATAFGVEAFRSLGRTAVLRVVARAQLVLGSTQAASVVDAARADAAGVEVVRRRSGGGAVLLEPGAQVWADVWIPRSDPLWRDEPRRLAASVGSWWADALGVPGARVHAGGSLPSPGSSLVCFAGVGPGEVLVDGRKLVGLAQWRGREGALVHGCAYRTWRAAPVLELLDMPAAARRRLAEVLEDAAVGLDAVVPAGWTGTELVRALPGTGWDVRTLGDAPPA